MIPRRVQLAVLIAFICHGLFILAARYRLSYDAYTHMLFADHYANNWFSLWEPRWYTGFTVVSYPPLTHQLIALFTPLLGFDAAFALILWIVTTSYPLGIYVFSRIFTGKTAATYAALASSMLVPIYVAAHIFGQLPFLTGTLFALFGAASLARYLREGGLHNFALTVSLATITMASHHATLIVQPFLIFAVVTSAFFHRGDTETPRFKKGFLAFSASQRLIIKRLAIFCPLAIITSILVIWPFWQWGMSQAMQTPIDHLSRHNFLTDPLAQAIFFWPLYGPLVAVIPFLFRGWHPRFWGLILSFIILFLLGLGGTTPLPRLFFGDQWEWLTYDRFALWASLTLTPFFGILFIRLKRGKKNRVRSKPTSATLRRNSIALRTFSVFAATIIIAWLTPILFPTQPAPVDMNPIVEFLNEKDHSQWRYLTFGFGNQFAYLNLLTTATTIDGSYHTARTLPELRESGIGEVDTAYWALKGIPAIGPILQKSGGHGVRWGFVNRRDFIPELKKNGWVFATRLKNGVQVWENPEAVLPNESQPPRDNLLASFSWGVFPLLALIITASLAALRLAPAQTEKILRGVHAVLIGLIPISLCFWYFRTLAEFPHARVYFTYTNALFFLSDALVLMAIILWVSTRIANMSLRGRSLITPILLLSALCLLSTLSLLWSRDWRASLYIALHFWFVLCFIIFLRTWRVAWKPVMLGLCAALSIQVITGFVEFASQSTAFLEPLKLNWPGLLEPSLRGASVVQLANGERILRAYGTLPHPNILGGFALIFMLGPAGLILTDKKPNYAALILFTLGIILLALTFSRSAWLGLIAFALVLIWKSKYFDRNHLSLLLAIGILTLSLTLYSLRDLVLTRVSNAPVATEQFSTLSRSWLAEQSLGIIREHPLIGVGIGSFILELANYAIEGEIIEPVHNVILLAGAELGVVGVILIFLLAILFARDLIKTRNPKTILLGATLTGISVIALFDHYFWTLAPARLLLGLMLGLWFGQVNDDDA